MDRHFPIFVIGLVTITMMFVGVYAYTHPSTPPPTGVTTEFGMHFTKVSIPACITPDKATGGCQSFAGCVNHEPSIEGATEEFAYSKVEEGWLVCAWRRVK